MAQLVEPDSLAYLPMGQAEHCIAAEVFENLPTAQSMHASAPPAPGPATDPGQENIILRHSELEFRPVLHPALQPPPPDKCQLILDEQSYDIVSAEFSEIELVDANPTLLPG